MDKDIILIISELPRAPIYTFSPEAIVHTAVKSNEILYNIITAYRREKMGKRPLHIGTGKVRSPLTVIRFRGTYTRCI